MPLRVFTGFLLVFVIAGLAGLGPATGQQAYRPFSKVVETWNQSLDRTAQEIAGVGFAIALALAITTVGFDLSNVAIIAGALSVGIAFGLQNVVNNFVSGLILLVERPIGVAYGSDVAQVMEILQRCLKEHESILRMPEPYVLFTGFGDSSLDFEARGQPRFPNPVTRPRRAGRAGFSLRLVSN